MIQKNTKKEPQISPIVVSEEIYLDEYMKLWISKIFSKRVENTTLNLARYVWEKIISPNIKYPIKIKQINVEYLNAVLEQSAKYSASSGNKARELLYMAFADAVAFGVITENLVKYTIRYPRKEPGVHILSKAELVILLNAAQSGNWYLEILLGVFLGLRKGEIYGLKFKDFSVRDRTVRISRQITSNPVKQLEGDKLNYNVVEKKLKTSNSYRILRVPPIIIEELNKRKFQIDIQKDKLGEAYFDNDYISCQSNGLPHAVSAFNTALNRLCKANGLPQTSVHSLRHQFATILLEQGVSVALISALLGHASINTTFEIYCDIMEGNSKITEYMNTTFKRKDDDY